MIPQDDPQQQPSPDPRAWLEKIQIKKRSTVANWFHQAVRTGATTPAEICHQVSQTVQRRLEWASPPETQQFLQAVLEALHLDPAGTLAYAASVLAYEQLPYKKRQRVKLERSFQYFKAQMKGQLTTDKQIWRLRHEGYTGPIPEDRAEASELIDRLQQQKGGY